MFDNMPEYAGYLNAQEQQAIFNRNKYEWCSELACINNDIDKLLTTISFCGATDKYIEELICLKKKLDLVYESLIIAPNKRLEDTSIVDKYLSTIEEKLF